MLLGLDGFDFDFGVGAEVHFQLAEQALRVVRSWGLPAR